jgi:hypothetical protein
MDTVSRRQTAWSLGLVVVIAATYAAVALAARSERFAAHVLARQEERWERTNGLYQEHVDYLDAEDKVLLHDLPNADYSRGGLYLLGSSTMQHAAIPWHWPSEMNAHLWAIKSANFKEQFQFVQFLAESEGWLAAGGDKPTVVLGLSHLDARMKLPGLVDADFVTALFKRHDLYEYTQEAGMSRLPLPGPVRAWRLERLRDYEFLKSTWNEYIAPNAEVHRRRTGRPGEDAGARAFLAKQLGGENWESTQQTQLAELSAMIDYLHSHKVRVAALLLPIMTWNDEQPFAAAFSQRAHELCQAKNVPLLDLARSVPDDEFFDDTHLAYRGQKRIDPQILEFVGVPALAGLH